MKIILLLLLVGCGQLRYAFHKTYIEKCAKGIAPTYGECENKSMGKK